MVRNNAYLSGRQFGIGPRTKTIGIGEYLNDVSVSETFSLGNAIDRIICKNYFPTVRSNDQVVTTFNSVGCINIPVV